MRWSVAGAAFLTALVMSSPGGADGGSPVTLVLDARDVAQRVLHVHETIAVRGPLELTLPVWIPGAHGPDGSIDQLVDLRIAANGRPVRFRRDNVRLSSFHVDVPRGATSLEITFDHLYAPNRDSSTPALAIVNPISAILYPYGAKATDVRVQATLLMPSGWDFGSALQPASNDRARVTFAPESLETLADSPIVTGRYLKRIEFERSARGVIDAVLVADDPADEKLADTTVTDLKNLVREADALTGARHWRNYHFLIALSDGIAHFGLEHHESSDDRLWGNSLTDAAEVQLSGDLLPHEFFHSWNGKFRRPAGLATADFTTPMRDELLWIYEGLTQYYGQVLSFRSGFRKPADYPDYLAEIAGRMEAQPGRATRSLLDTAVGIPVERGSSGLYDGVRRGADYYPEGALVWLEADMVIRARSEGRKSLDDFVSAFFGGGRDAAPSVLPYTREDVIAALNAVQPLDWATFFRERVDAVRPHLSMDGFALGGYRLTYTSEIPTYPSLRERSAHRGNVYDARWSLGMQIAGEGHVNDVFPGSPGAKAGLAPGMSIIAVNGKRYSGERMHAAVAASTDARARIVLIAENAGFVRSYAIDYHGGERYPHLERIAGTPDRLSASVEPRAKVTK